MVIDSEAIDSEAIDSQAIDSEAIDSEAIDQEVIGSGSLIYRSVVLRLKRYCFTLHGHGTVKRQEHNASTSTRKEVYGVFVVFDKCCQLHQNIRTEYVIWDTISRSLNQVDQETSLPSKRHHCEDQS